MRKITSILFICFMTIVLSTATHAAVIYYEDFDATNGGYTHGGTQDEWEWGLDVNVGGVHTCWGTDLDSDYNNDSDQWLRSVAIDLTSVDASQPLTLSFDFFGMSEFSYDLMYFDYSIDGGISWVNYYTGSTSDQSYEKVWRFHSEDITGLALNVLELRWSLTSDVSVTRKGLYIDNVLIDGTPNAVPEPATLLLLGVGLVGLAGLRRQM